MKLELLISAYMIVVPTLAFPAFREGGHLVTDAEVANIRRDTRENTKSDMKSLFDLISCFPHGCKKSE